MAVVDPTGNLLAYITMDNLRLFSRRHALRKAYTAAVLGTDSGANAQRLHSQGRSISELGDPNLTNGQGGLVIRKDGVILGQLGGTELEEMVALSQVQLGQDPPVVGVGYQVLGYWRRKTVHLPVCPIHCLQRLVELAFQTGLDHQLGHPIAMGKAG